MKDDIKGKTCQFCGEPAAYTDRIGSCRLYVCDDSECSLAFDQEMREAENELRERGQEAGAADNYERYW